MLVGLGALLVVAAALAFVAVAWTRLGVVFQAGVMLVVTALLCGASAWTARRQLRATEEALAAAGAALLAVDLGAARALGLFRLEDVGLRPWWAISCAVVVLAAVGLGRLTRTTATWPLVALLAAQPLPFLLLTGELLTGPAGVAVALGVAAADVAGRPDAAARAPAGGLGPRRASRPSIGVLGGLATAVGSDPGDSWTATGVLAVGRRRRPRPGPPQPGDALPRTRPGGRRGGRRAGARRLPADGRAAGAVDRGRVSASPCSPSPSWSRAGRRWPPAWSPPGRRSPARTRS